MLLFELVSSKYSFHLRMGNQEYNPKQPNTVETGNSFMYMRPYIISN